MQVAKSNLGLSILSCVSWNVINFLFSLQLFLEPLCYQSNVFFAISDWLLHISACPAMCSRVRKLVCGSDGITYGNPCALEYVSSLFVYISWKHQEFFFGIFRKMSPFWCICLPILPNSRLSQSPKYQLLLWKVYNLLVLWFHFRSRANHPLQSAWPVWENAHVVLPRTG